MAELDDSLARMNFMQLLLLFAFVTSYVLAIGGLVGPAARLRFALLAVALSAGFVASTDPWVHGALLMAFVVAGLGMFVLLTWLLAWWLGPRPAVAVPTAAVDSVLSSAQPVPSSHDTAVSASPELSGSARALP